MSGKKPKDESQDTHQVTRREFVETAVTVGAAAILGVGCSGGGGDTTATDADTDGEPATFDDVPLGQVVITRAETPAEAVARGIMLMNGLTFIEPGQKVMLKPNMTGPIPPPDTTSCNVLVELIEQCNDAGAGEVIVAERTYGPFSTPTVFDFPMCGDGTQTMLEAITDAGATFRPLDDEPWDDYTLPEDTDFDRPIRIPRILTEIDHMINVPALKTHTISVFTMSMKNLFGLIHPSTRDDDVHGDPRSTADGNREKRMFAQMNLAFSPTLNVLDGIVSRTTGGPMPPGDEADTNMVLMSKDRVAIDAVGLAVLRYYGSETWVEDKPVWDQVQLAEAIRWGIGIDGPDDVTLVAENIRELADIEAILRET